MLYKYIKNEPTKIVIRISDVSITPKKKSKAYSALTVLCFFIGASLLTYSFFPYLSKYTNHAKGQSNSSKYLLSPSPLLDGSTYNAIKSMDGDLTSNYISNVNRNFSITNELLNINERTFPEYANIKGTMKLTIPRLGLKDLPVVLNVNSFEEVEYLPYLENNLAHFQGTSLPDKEGNTFIYGHSANELLSRSDPKNPRYAFTFLDEIEIGDEIILTYNGKKYTYSMNKLKFVNPEDISPIYTTSNDKILTLMSCWTPGVGNQRIIVIAKLIEETEI